MKARPICGIDDAVLLVTSICHTEGYLFGDVEVVDAPSDNTGGVVIKNCRSTQLGNAASTNTCYHTLKSEEINDYFVTVQKCYKNYNVTCRTVEGKTIAIEHLLKNTGNYFYVLSNPGSRSDSKANCKLLGMDLVSIKDEGRI